jgi:hypothetical protein
MMDTLSPLEFNRWAGQYYLPKVQRKLVDPEQERFENLINQRPMIELWNNTGCYLIVLKPTGVWITNQVGGTACLHPCVEGILIPLTAKDPDSGCSNYYWNDNGLGDQSLAILDNYLRQITDGVITVNMDLCDKSYEAWVHVNIAEVDTTKDHLASAHGFRTMFHDFGAGKGILTWQNSD